MPADANIRPRDFAWRSMEGLELHAREYGAPNSKLPVVLMHGLTRNSRDFEEVAPWIAAQGRRVFAVDFRGRGRSSWKGKPRRYRPNVYAEDVARLLKAIAAPQALFVGTSLGGLVTMILGARHLKLIGGAVLNDVGPHIGREGLKRIASYAGRPAPVHTWADAAAYAERTNGHAFPHYGQHDWEAFSRRVFREDESGVPSLDYDPRIFRPVPPWAMRLSEWFAWRAFKRLARCGRLLLVRGETSGILEPRTVARMSRMAPAMTLAEIPGVGHAPMLTEPEARTAIAEFLARAP
jgi:pimeloyl-ACP methyl ester carboxylesterase